MINQTKILELLKQAGLDFEPKLDEFNKPFEDIGLDSLDVFNFLSEIEIELGQSIDDSDFEHLNTLNDVIRFLNV